MANSGAFIKGEKKPNQGKRGPAKVSLKARAAVAALVDGNVHKLEEWLTEIAAKDPEKAWRCMMDVIEYHIPKLQRSEVAISGVVDVRPYGHLSDAELMLKRRALVIDEQRSITEH